MANSSAQEKLFNETVESVAWILARKIHKDGLGILPADDDRDEEEISPLDVRMSLFPHLYKTRDELSMTLEKEAVDVLPEAKRLKKSSSSFLQSDVNDTESSLSSPSAAEEFTNSSTAATANKTPVTRQQTNSLDIWGRCPPKEPKEAAAACPICQRSLSTLRFAPHLDKCMGIGTTSRAGTPRNAAPTQMYSADM